MSDTAAAQALPPARYPSKKAGDYLSATLFLAALFHGVLIMGVTFTAGDPPEDSDRSTSLEVVILTGDYEKLAAPEDAELLAARNLIGSGNTAEDVPVTMAYGQTGDTAIAGQPQDGAEREVLQQQSQPNKDMLLHSQQVDKARLETQLNETELAQQQKRGLAGDSNPTEIIAEPDQQTQIKSSNPRELIISANTRESRIASYLDGWKRKIERVGTMNFPAVTSAATQNPILEVAVSADGTLKEILVLRPSGQKQLDQAAINIVRLASPFDPFPELLASEYDVLRFSYEWYFTGDTPGSKLSVSGQQ